MLLSVLRRVKGIAEEQTVSDVTMLSHVREWPVGVYILALVLLLWESLLCAASMQCR